jgi:hypothetical protein
MKLRHPAWIRTLGFAGAWVLKGWLSTLRLREDTTASGGLPVHPRRRRFIFAFWHEHILLGTRYGAKSQVLISKHADGELITQIVLRMGMTAARGSSRRGGAGAVLEMIRSNTKHHLALTPDGPQGPRRKVQSGLTFLASRTGLPVVLIGFGYEKAWRAKSWDQFAVPYPFSLATCVTSAPLHVPARLNSAGLETYRRLLEDRLNYLNEDAQRWAEGRPRLPPLTAEPISLAASA